MLHQLALEAGKKRLSEQTNFVHQGDLIPVVDNFLYALALMRTKVADRIIEAKDLIERLLPFQSESGNFPVNLHEWPKCSDRLIGAHILIPMHWIIADFGAVLGSALNEKLIKSQTALRKFLKEVQTERALSELAQLKMLASCGDQGINAILDRQDPWLFQVPRNLGEVLVAYQLIDPSLARYLPYLSQVTHASTHLYCGQPVNEYQDGDVAETTLFDLYVAALSGKMTERVKKDHPIHLWAAAIQPFEVEWKAEGRDHNFYQGTAPESKHKGLHHFRYLWGELSKPYSLVCQAGNFKKWNFQEEPNKFHFQFELDAYDHENDRDVAFYFNYQPMEFTIDGKAATTFNLDEPIKIKTQDRTFEFQFKGEKGLVGHIMRGNRLSQISAKGDLRYNSYDWVLFLRSVRRAIPYHLDVYLSVS